MNGKNHSWSLLTALGAGAWGVEPNAFEIWEYPSYEVTHTFRRFAIERGVNGCKTTVICSKRSVNIGYASDFRATDVNDLSINGNVGISTLNTNGYKLAVKGKIRANEIVVETG